MGNLFSSVDYGEDWLEVMPKNRRNPESFAAIDKHILYSIKEDENTGKIKEKKPIKWAAAKRWNIRKELYVEYNGRRIFIVVMEKDLPSDVVYVEEIEVDF